MRMIECAVEKERDRDRSVIEIYEHIDGGVHIDRPVQTSTDAPPPKRIRSSADKGTKLHPKRRRET
jgi:hypothetical protein